MPKLNSNERKKFMDATKDFTEVFTAFERIKTHIHKDKEYARAWHHNFAGIVISHGIPRLVANRAADDFMWSFFRLDTTKGFS